MQPYKTTSDFGTAYYEIQKSKFYTYTAHVEDEAAAREFIQSIKKKHFDARHNCSAWILGSDSSQQKSNDDGEPGGTAGNPILEAIKQHELTNVVVVVTRYFGGIKLGAGGLIRAYNHSASLGLEATPQVEVKPVSTLSVQLDYSQLGTIENWVRNNNIRSSDTVYTDKVTLQLLVEPDNIAAVTSSITDLTAGNAAVTASPPKYLAIAIE
ncbi:MAG: YigZ family protein [Anaerovibrio sp.]|uniref:YigZ family protein n=1 Tax=Anaerovibrio sp. TaxID=1872532 RepID=UPI0025E44496|nr:YigZ family protein [Anaerovibrio sp.]MCR5176750.1 YigZ family protein [Anaerovibrio sp.]